MVYAMARWAWHGIWYCLASMAWYIVFPGGHGSDIWYCLEMYVMVYDVAWWADMYMGWPCGHGMVMV